MVDTGYLYRRQANRRTDSTTNSSSGVLYLTIEMAFSSSTSPIDIGGVRLTLEYDD